MEQLTGLDAAFLYTETPSTPMHIAGFGVYESVTQSGDTVRFKDIMRMIEDRLHLAKAYRRKLVNVPFNLDYPYWIEDPNFDIEFHLRHIRLPKPGDWRQLCIQLARLHSRMLDLDRPLWEAYVIEGLDNVEGIPEGSFAMLTKTHHAAIDGATGAELTAIMHDLTPEPTKVPLPDKPWVPERVPTDVELMVRTYGNNIRQPFRMAEVLAQAAPGLAKVAIANLRGDEKLKALDQPVPKTRFNARVSAHRSVDAIKVSLADVKKIRPAVEGCTVNDVMLSVVGGALRKYLQDKDELPNESCAAMAPINTRTKEEEGTGGNKVSQMIVTLRTDIADPIERLQKVYEGTQKSKALTDAVGARVMTDLTQFVPSGLAALGARLAMRFALSNNAAPAFNCVVTNVPGPQIPLFSNGALMVGSYGLGPLSDGLGLFHAVTSYNGDIAITVTACRDMMPDPAFYAECLQSTFDELLSAAAGGVRSAAE